MAKDNRDFVLLAVVVAFSVTLFLGLNLFQYNNPPYSAAAMNQNSPGAAAPMPGSDRDAHGCRLSAGYTWCEAQSTCLRPFETPCLNIYTESFPPYNFMDKNGTVSGSSTAVVMEIMKRLNTSGRIELLNWSASYNHALNEQHSVLYSAERTPARENLFRWAGPIGEYDYTFFSKNGSIENISILDDAKKARSICVVKDDARDQFLESSGFVNLVLAPNDMTCAGMVQAGDAELWLGSDTNFEDIVADGGYLASEFQPIITVKRTELYLAFSRDIPQSVVDKWQNSLDSMKVDGKLDSIKAVFSDPEVAVKPTAYTPCFMEQSDWKAVQAGEIVDIELKDVEATLNATASGPEARSGNISAIESVLIEAMQKHPAGEYLYALPNGMYYTTTGIASGNVADRPYLQAALGGEISIGTTITGRSSGKNGVVVAVPVFSGANVSGVLAASMFLDNLSTDTSSALRVPADVQFFALDRDGQIVLDKNTEAIMSGDKLLDGGTQYALGNGNGTVNYMYQGETWSGTFKRSDLTGWTYVLSYVPADVGACGS